jgi:putative inorganic carbon (HCO3(-)) transporter
MLRTLFVMGIVLLGIINARRGPFYVLLFYMWFAYFRPEAWVWGSLVQSLDLSLIAGVVLVVATIFAGTVPRINTSVLLILIFTAHGLLSTLLSEHFAYAWHYWLEFAKAALISCLIVALTTDRAKFRLLLMVIALSLGFEGAKQGWAQFVLNPGAVNNNSHPMLGDNNGVALGMLMIVPLFAALAETAKSRLEKPAHWFMLIGVFLRAITTYSRGAFVSTGAMSFVYLLRSKHKVRVLAGMILIATIGLSAMPQEFWDRMQTITVSEEERDDSQRGRLHYWRVAMNMARDNPITGVGFNSFSRAYDEYDFSDGEYGRTRAAHSTWFGVLGDLGVPGLLIEVALLIASLVGSYRVRRMIRARSDLDDLRIFANALDASLIAFVVGGTFLPAQYTEMLWHFFGLSAALQLIARDAVAGTAAVEVAPVVSVPVHTAAARNLLEDRFAPLSNRLPRA